MFFHDRTLEEISKAVTVCHADSLEFWLETPDFWFTNPDITRLKRVIHESHLKTPLSIHTPVLDLNPCSINPDICEISIKWIEKTIILAKLAGAQTVTIHPGKRTVKRPASPDDYIRLDNMLRRIELISTNNPDIHVAIENMEPLVNSVIFTPEKLKEIIDKWPFLWCTIDTCHVRDQGFSILQEYFRVLHGRIANVHLSGGDNGMHGRVKGDKWAALSLDVIRKSGYNGVVTLEINDLKFENELNFSEKLQILSEEIEFVRDHLR